MGEERRQNDLRVETILVLERGKTRLVLLRVVPVRLMIFSYSGCKISYIQ
jgi:hypothetical protein